MNIRRMNAQAAAFVIAAVIVTVAGVFFTATTGQIWIPLLTIIIVAILALIAVEVIP